MSIWWFSIAHRAMVSLGSLAAALVVAAFAAIPLAGQTPTGAAKAKASSTWTVPRTPDGKPDLQGTWLNFDQTPFEQPLPPDPAMKSGNAPAAPAPAPL